MTDHTKTITNSFNLFGIAPTTYWGIFIWGAANWGEGDDVIINIGKLISESISLADTLFKQSSTLRSNSLSFSSEMANEYLKDANGYFYILTKPTTDGELRSLTSYTELTGSTASYATTGGGSITWTET